jgi:hypothetical protein
MRNLLHAGIVALLLTPAATDVPAQAAGEKKLGVAVIERNHIIKGGSARHQILSQSVKNDKDENIGKVEDIIFTPERSASCAIVSTAGFLGMGSHDVAVPAAQFKRVFHRTMM